MEDKRHACPTEAKKGSTLESILSLLHEDPVPVVMVETFLKGQAAQMEALLASVVDLEAGAEESIVRMEGLESEIEAKSTRLEQKDFQLKNLAEEVSQSAQVRDALKNEVEGLTIKSRVAEASILALTEGKGQLTQSVLLLENTVHDLESQLAKRWQKLVDEVVGRMEVCGFDEVSRERFRQRLPRLGFEDLDNEWESISDEFNRLFVVSPVTVRDLGTHLSAKDFSSYRVRER